MYMTAQTQVLQVHIKVACTGMRGSAGGNIGAGV